MARSLCVPTCVPKFKRNGSICRSIDKESDGEESEISLVVQFEKNDPYQGIALAMPSKGVRCNGFSR